MSCLFSKVILQRKHLFKRNLGSPVKNCPRVSLICLSESVRRGPILIGCDIYWGLVQDVHADSDKLNRMDRFKVSNSEDNLSYITVGSSFLAYISIINKDGAILRSTLSYEEAEDIGLTGNDAAGYVMR